MSLARLLNCYMTIQTAEHAPQNANTQGAVDRSGSWVNIKEFENINCALQEQGARSIISQELGLVQELHRDVIFHQSRRLREYDVNQTSLRIIMKKAKPQSALSFPVADHEIDIFTFKGHIQEVQHHPRINLYILRCERNKQQSA